MLLLITFLYMIACSRSGEKSGPPRNCEEAMERFSDALIDEDYSGAYAVTAKTFQEKVHFSDFIEKQRQLNEKTGKPDKWGIPEMGCFQTDGDHGCGIDFGHRKENGEVVPEYRCIVIERQQDGACYLDQIDCSRKYLE